jgi:hypothetical protein
MKGTHIEAVVDQVICDTSEHIQACQNIFHMVEDIRL